jgi:hypothetical protein
MSDCRGSHDSQSIMVLGELSYGSILHGHNVHIASYRPVLEMVIYFLGQRIGQ